MTRTTETAGVNVGQENFAGILCIRNITPDVETGIGSWTDGEIIRAVREGVDHNGEGLFPIMPYFIYRHVSDKDMEAVVAYLRSMEPGVSVRPERQIDFPLNLMVKMWPEPVDGPVIAPDPSDRINYGEYLATIARCELNCARRSESSKVSLIVAISSSRSTVPSLRVRTTMFANSRPVYA